MDEIKIKLNKLVIEFGKFENIRKEVEKELYEFLFFLIRRFLFWFYMLIKLYENIIIKFEKKF